MPLFSQHTARFSPDVPLEGTSSRELLKRYQPLETLATGGFGSIEICRDSASGFKSRMLFSFRRISPEEGFSRPTRSFIIVDFPAPLEPISATLSPLWISRFNLENTV